MRATYIAVLTVILLGLFAEPLVESLTDTIHTLQARPTY